MSDVAGKVHAPVYIRFERGRDDVTGPVFGPFEWVQQTYRELRSSPDGEPFAYWNEKAGEWFILNGPHEDEFYSDFIVLTSDKIETDEEHNCAAGKITYGNAGKEERWSHESESWVTIGEKVDGA